MYHVLQNRDSGHQGSGTSASPSPPGHNSNTQIA